MKLRFATTLLIALGAHWTGAAAQNSPDPAAPQAACPARGEQLPVQALYGRWEATLDGSDSVAAVEFHRHPEYEGGVRGTLARGAAPVAQLAGDIDDDGLLVLDESQDGRAISAVWSGELQLGSCGREFRGTRRESADDSTRAFVLRKAPARP